MASPKSNGKSATIQRKSASNLPRTQNDEKANRFRSYLTPREIQKAMKELVRDAQRNWPHVREIRRQLELYEDVDGLLRCHGHEQWTYKRRPHIHSSFQENHHSFSLSSKISILDSTTVVLIQLWVNPGRNTGHHNSDALSGRHCTMTWGQSALNAC